jgi:hypothetical protein
MLLKEVHGIFKASFLEKTELAAARNITKLYCYSEHLRNDKCEKNAFNKYIDVFKCSKGQIVDLLISQCREFLILNQIKSDSDQLVSLLTHKESL